MTVCSKAERTGVIVGCYLCRPVGDTSKVRYDTILKRLDRAIALCDLDSVTYPTTPDYQTMNNRAS